MIRLRDTEVKIAPELLTVCVIVGMVHLCLCRVSNSIASLHRLGGIEHILWTAAGAKGGRYIAIFNAGEEDSTVKIPLSDLELYEKVTGYELWSGEKFTEADCICASLKKHGAKAYFLE